MSINDCKRFFEKKEKWNFWRFTTGFGVKSEPGNDLHETVVLNSNEQKTGRLLKKYSADAIENEKHTKPGAAAAGERAPRYSFYIGLIHLAGFLRSYATQRT